MSFNLNENFHSVVGFVLFDFPGYAVPYFVDRDGNFCIQDIKDNKIVKTNIFIENILGYKGLHNFRGINYLEKDFYTKRIYAFAFSETNFCVGRKEEVENFIKKNYKKYKKAIKKNEVDSKIKDLELDLEV